MSCAESSLLREIFFLLVALSIRLLPEPAARARRSRSRETSAGPALPDANPRDFIAGSSSGDLSAGIRRVNRAASIDRGRAARSRERRHANKRLYRSLVLPILLAPPLAVHPSFSPSSEPPPLIGD